MIKGIIFDLDGVLVFTDKYHYLAWKKIADEENIYFDESINEQLRGVSRMDSLEIILKKSLKKYSEQEKNALANKKNDYYRQYLEQMSSKSVSPLVIDTLTKLKEMKIKLAIGSSSKNTKYILEKTKLLNYFDAISDGNNIAHSKPDPEVFLKARDMLNLNSDECLVIEDAEAGILAAYRGGFIAIGIQQARLCSYCNYGISAINQIIPIIKEINHEK